MFEWKYHFLDYAVYFMIVAIYLFHNDKAYYVGTVNNQESFLIILSMIH